MSDIVDVIVIGAGQAGLSLSYYLTQQGRPHILLEKAPHTIANWRTRWDSFTIVLPNWTLRIPMPYDGDDPDGFIHKDELIAHFDRFQASFNPDIHFNVEVTSLAKAEGDEHFTLQTNEGEMRAKNVVCAIGTFQIKHVPAIASQIAPEIQQIHSDDYANPNALPPGGVLVVGTGQSGAQIAEELKEAGRDVYLCVGSANRTPRSYRGKDIIWWFNDMGLMDAEPASLDNSRMRFTPNPFLSGKDGGRELNLHKFAQDGMHLLGHLESAQGSIIQLAPDLHDNLRRLDQYVIDFKADIDAHIEKTGQDFPLEAPTEALTDGFEQSIIESLDLKEAGIKTIIWGTGYRFNYDWIHFPIMDQDGYPITERGVTEIPGLYFLGLQWLWKRRSGLLFGIGEDAKYLAEQMEKAG